MYTVVADKENRKGKRFQYRNNESLTFTVLTKVKDDLHLESYLVEAEHYSAGSNLSFVTTVSLTIYSENDLVWLD